MDDYPMLSDRAKALCPVIQAAFEAGGLDDVCELFAKLEARIEELEKRLHMNSSNSSKPPSSDGLKRKTKPLTADYDGWIAKGLKAHPKIEKQPGKRGRAKQSKERNLLMRMKEKRVEVLRFTHDLSVPDDNNQAERDLRMIEVRQKESGCFLSERGAGVFCAIRSYPSTARAHRLNLMDSIKTTFAGAPMDFTPK